MDFETLFYLVLVVVYVLYQIVGSRTQKPSPRPERPQRSGQPQPEQPEPARSEAPDELDQALREIRQALGMESPPAPEPAPPPEPPTAQQPPPLTPTTPSPSTTPGIPEEPPSEVTTEAPVAHWIEDTFETHEAGTGEETLLDEVEITVQSASAPTSRRPALLRRLRKSGAAREAIVLSEILGPPRSRRR